MLPEAFADAVGDGGGEADVLRVISMILSKRGNS